MFVRNRLRAMGFTLLELLVVIALIALLASIVGPRVFQNVERGAVVTAKVQINTLKTSIETFKLDTGRYPTAQEGLSVLARAPADAAAAGRWRGPYLDGEVPLDPWNNPYQYSIPGAEGHPFALYSFGNDGKRGGEGDAADIGILPPN